MPRAADAELFVIGAELEGSGPALFIVESTTEGVLTQAEPAIGLRAAGTGDAQARRTSSFPAGALLADGDADVVRRVRPARPDRLVRDDGRHRAGRARLPDPLRQGPQGLRRADRPPPGRRLQHVEHRDRGRGDAPDHLPRRQPRRPGQGLRPRVGDRPPALRRQGHADRLRRRAAPRRPRLRQGVPGRALVPRPSRRRRRSREACSSDGHQPRGPEEVRAARRPGAHGRGRGAAPDLAQVRPRRARVPQGARHARRAHRRPRRGRRHRAAPAPPASARPSRTATAATATAPTWRRSSRSSRCAGATSACC